MTGVFLQIWFRFRASTSGIAMVGHVIGQTIGMITAGFVIYKFKPKAIYVCLWTVLGSLFLTTGLFGISYTSCKRAPWITTRGKSL